MDLVECTATVNYTAVTQSDRHDNLIGTSDNMGIQKHPIMTPALKTVDLLRLVFCFVFFLTMSSFTEELGVLGLVHTTAPNPVFLLCGLHLD